MPFMKIMVTGPFFGTEQVEYVELPDDWDDMTQGEQEAFEDEVWDTSVDNYIDGFTEIVEDQGD